LPAEPRQPDRSRPTNKPLDPATIAAQAGAPELLPAAGTPLVPAITPATVFAYPDLDSVDAAMLSDRRVYRRYGDEPTMRLEQALAALETPPNSTNQPPITRITASGQAALTLLLLTFAEPQRRRVVVVRPCYGGTDALLAGPLARAGMELATVDLPHPAEPADHAELVSQAIDDRTCAVVCDVITNPLIGVADIPAIARAAHEKRAACIVDNTFTTPFLFQPFAHGADAVFHSLTKHLNGHSDVIGGAALVAATHPAANNLDPTNRLLGATPGSFDSWLALRGLRTAALRVAKATENAAALAGWLASSRQEIAAVHYPGLRGPLDEELTHALLPKGRGPMLTIELSGGEPAIDRLLGALQLIRLAPSLGDVATTVSHPRRTSHRGLSDEECARLGITGGLLRISVGIEALDDLQDDLAQALDATH
jgi:cystathionine gamma-synthase